MRNAAHGTVTMAQPAAAITRLCGQTSADCCEARIELKLIVVTQLPMAITITRSSLVSV